MIGFAVAINEKNFVTDFSGTVKAVKLKLGTHRDNGLMYAVYPNQGQGPITLGVILQFTNKEKFPFDFSELRSST